MSSNTILCRWVSGQFLHGIPRATQDIDIIADIGVHHITPLVKALESEFYIDEEMVRESVRLHSCFNIIHIETMFKIDIFVLQNDITSHREMERRKRYVISDQPENELWLASAEDIILRKLYWFRLGGGVSERQWNDVLGVLRVNKDTDYVYLKRGAKNLGVEILLEKIMKEITDNRQPITDPRTPAIFVDHS